MRAAIAALLIAGCSPGEPVVATTPLDVKPVPSASVASRPAAAAKEKTTFTKRDAAVGDQNEQIEDLAFSMHLSINTSANAQNSDVGEQEHMTKQVEVLAVRDGTPTKVRVTYRTATKDGKPKPIDGKTYVVEAVNGVPRVHDSKGKEPPDPENALVRKDFRSLGKPDPLKTGLPTTPIGAGDRVDSLAQAVAEYMNRDEASGVSTSDVVVTYRGRTGDEGLFDIALTLSKVDASMQFRVKLAGEMRVRVNGAQTTGMTLSGPITIDANPNGQAGLLITGSGSMTLSLSATR